MIFGTLEDRSRYAFLEEKIQRCLMFAQEEKLLDFETGTHAIDGETIFVNIAEYETTLAENRVWEAHRNYMDLHMILRGEERIDLNFVVNMKQGVYVAADDFLPLEGEANSYVRLTPGDFLICDSQDGHRTAVLSNGAQPVKKAIFKIRL